MGNNISNVANDAGELSYQVEGVTKSFSLFDEAGEMLSTFDVLEKIAEDWDKMSTAEQQAVGIALAGN